MVYSTRPQPFSRNETIFSWRSAEKFQMFSSKTIREIVEKTVMVDPVTNKHHGQRALITKKDCDKSHKAKTRPRPYTTCATRMNQRGKATSPIPAIATVITTGSVINPMKELGNPRSWDCQDFATVPQESTELMLHDNFSDGAAANLIASIDRTRDAMRLKVDETNIAM